MKNIEINYLDVSGYEVLYPKTTTENLIDFGEVLYTKEEVDGFIAELDNRIDNQIGALRFTYGGYVGQFSSYDISLGGNTKATNWQIITLGFKPIGLILSYENSFDTDSVFCLVDFSAYLINLVAVYLSLRFGVHKAWVSVSFNFTFFAQFV